MRANRKRNDTFAKSPKTERACLPVQEHVVGRREVDVPTADGHHLEGRAGRQVQHQVGDGLQERVEHPRQRVDRLAGHVQVAQRVPASGLGGVAGAVSRAHLGRQGDHEPPQQVVQTRGARHFVQQPVQRLTTVGKRLICTLLRPLWPMKTSRVVVSKCRVFVLTDANKVKTS